MPGQLENLSRSECLTLLADNEFGRVVVAGSPAAPPLIRPVNYIYDEATGSVVFRTARGSKFHAMVRAASACFEIDGIDPGARSGWSVIISGVAEELTRPTDLRRLDAAAPESWASGQKRHWLSIRAWTVSGRRTVHPG